MSPKAAPPRAQRAADGGSLARARPADLHWLLAIVLGATTIRAGWAATFPPIADEAYYWLWARHLALSYREHPPMIAYLIYLTTRLGDQTLWLRLAPLLLGAATTYVLYLLARDLFEAGAGVRAALLTQVVPILAGVGMVATPDAPLSLAWVLGLRFAWQAVRGRPERWMAFGLAMGLGLQSKVPVIFLGLGVALFVLLHHRGLLRRKGPYLAALLAGGLFLPVLYWNATHQWAAVGFALGGLRQVSPYGAPRGLLALRLFLEQYLPLVGVLFPAFLWALWQAWRRRGDERFAFLLWTAVPIAAFSLLAAPGGAVGGHWIGPAHLGLAVVVAALWNRAVTALAAVNAALIAVFLALALLPWLPPIPGASEAYGWREAAGAATSQAALDEVVVSDDWGIAALLAYHSGGRLPVTVVPRADAASIWPPLQGSTVRAIGVSDARWRAFGTGERCFGRVEEASRVAVSFRGRQVRTFRLVRLQDLLPSCRAP